MGDHLRRTRKFSKRLRIAAVTSLVLVAFCGAGVWFLSRETTLIQAANYVVKRSEGRLEVADLKGSLLGTMHVRELRVKDKFGALTINDARLEWRPVRLLIGQVAVGEVAAESVALHLAKAEEERKRPPESLASPLSFAVTDFHIGTLRIDKEDGSHALRDLRAAFSGNRKQLTAELKALTTPLGRAQGKLELGAASPFELSGELELKSLRPEEHALTAKLGGSLLNAETTLDARAREATAAAKLAIAPYELQPLTLLEFSAKDFDPRAWVATAPSAALSGEAHIAADAERRLNGAIAFTNGKPGTIDEKRLPFARLSGTVQGVLDELTLADVKLDLAQAGQFTGSGAVRDGVLDVALDTRNLNLQGLQKRLHKTNLAGKLALGGNAQKQRARFDLTQQAYHFRFAGTLADGIARIDEAYGRAGNAELKTRGRITLGMEKAFTAAGELRNFDPSKFGAYPSHVINGRFDAKGHMQPVLQVAANVNVSDSRLSGLPATATGTFRSRRTDHSDVEMDVRLRVGDTRASAKGVVRDPAQSRSIDMQLTLAGASLAELYRIIGVPLPPTPAYRIQGRLVQRGEQWAFRQFAGAVGDSDLSGDFLVDRGRTPQLMTADLRSNRLALVDLAGFVGAEKTASGKVATPEDPTRVLPTAPYNLEKLKAADADIRFHGKQIVTEKLPVQNMSTHLVVKGGVLTLSPLNFGVADGDLLSHITLDARAAVIASRADIRVRSLQLEQLLPKLKISKASVGEMDGRVRLTARGNSIAAMLGSANGDTTFILGEGEVSDLILRLANLDLANTLLVLMRGDRNIPIRCMVADLAFENGIMRPRQFVFDATHTTLVGEGQANFADETLDLRLVARPKDRSLLSLRGPIVVSGSFVKPVVRPDMGRLAARGAAAAALGIVATPLAGLVPLRQMGGGENVQCAPLVQAAKQKIHQPASQLAAR